MAFSSLFKNTDNNSTNEEGNTENNEGNVLTNDILWFAIRFIHLIDKFPTDNDDTVPPSFNCYSRKSDI